MSISVTSHVILVVCQDLWWALAYYASIGDKPDHTGSMPRSMTSLVILCQYRWQALSYYARIYDEPCHTMPISVTSLVILCQYRWQAMSYWYAKIYDEPCHTMPISVTSLVILVVCQDLWQAWSYYANIGDKPGHTMPVSVTSLVILVVCQDLWRASSYYANISDKPGHAGMQLFLHWYPTAWWHTVGMFLTTWSANRCWYTITSPALCVVTANCRQEQGPQLFVRRVQNGNHECPEPFDN